MIINNTNKKIKLPGFVVFEGGNAVGKSTLLKNVALRISHEVIQTREPGGTELGNKIRTLVKSNIQIDPLSELFLFAADRAEHITKLILPALKNGKSVFSDRYFYSTLAFQGAGRNLDSSMVEQIVNLTVSNTIPDLVILVDLPIEESIKRSTKRDSESSFIEEDKFEAEKNDFQERVRQGFLKLAETRPEPWIVLDGMKTPEVLTLEVLSYLI